MSQAARLVLRPDNRATVGSWTPRGPIPEALRLFGRFPDVSSWLPGDLILFNAVSPDFISRAIIGTQRRGGFAMNDAQWHHAAVYLGDDVNICEAVTTGIRFAPMYPYVGKFNLRVRRDPNLTDRERWTIAMLALTRLHSAYGFPSIARLWLRSIGGFWGAQRLAAPLAAGNSICSQLYADSYATVTLKLLTTDNLPTPAALNLTDKLVDVESGWLKISS